MASDEPSSPRRRSLAPSAARPVAAQGTASLTELIEHERGELMQLHAMIKCLNDVLLYADDDDSPMHADVAQLVARLLDESIGRLDAIRIRVAELERAAEESSNATSEPPPYQVREQRASYMC